MENQVLTDYLTKLVDDVYGADLDADAKREAVQDLQGAFSKLFNARLLETLRDDQLDQAEQLAASGRANEILQLAQQNGTNMPALMAAVIKEFEELYAPRG